MLPDRCVNSSQIQFQTDLVSQEASHINFKSPSCLKGQDGLRVETAQKELENMVVKQVLLLIYQMAFGKSINNLLSSILYLQNHYPEWPSFLNTLKFYENCQDVPLNLL